MAKPSHIIVGMSGGVDSSVAAYLLKEAGHNVEGVFMKNWEGDDTDDYCPAADDMADAQAVCDKLGIPLRLVNFASEYWENVFAYFLSEYRAGRTPNPDILCNREIKFKAFLEYAKLQGADFIATGHYVRKDDQHRLLKGSDPDKDQSYFLYALQKSQLESSLFPVGELRKPEVRAIAEKIGLANHAKKDSTGICFIGERKFKSFLNEYLPAKPGSIETPEGEVIGRHDGLMFYTIGQRQGLQIGGIKNKSELPWYVADKDLSRNTLIVVQGEHPALFKSSLICSQLTFTHEPPALPAKLKAKTRYRQPDQACRLDALENGQFMVTFEQPQRAVTPGQSCVFYQDDICLGGGIIES
ncbi:MAG TPA: tRNA 2-thiouridine(34) synthase MnmA [Gammaproteobacteria bacterium]|jgi:tRNA-specific 2-thiouridylase|nr:tRNA 2-thiouridine(34) synthase MnmA [Gammaproteobacteria bacterium]